jgi:hypothetical protein
MVWATDWLVMGFKGHWFILVLAGLCIRWAQFGPLCAWVVVGMGSAGHRHRLGLIMGWSLTWAFRDWARQCLD